VKPPSAFKTGNSLIVVAWVAQTFPQLALLPIVIVGQNVQAAAADARAEATYNDAAAVLEEAKQIQAHPEAQNAERSGRAKSDSLLARIHRLTAEESGSREKTSALFPGKMWVATRHKVPSRKALVRCDLATASSVCQ